MLGTPNTMLGPPKAPWAQSQKQSELNLIVLEIKCDPIFISKIYAAFLVAELETKIVESL